VQRHSPSIQCAGTPLNRDGREKLAQGQATGHRQATIDCGGSGDCGGGVNQAVEQGDLGARAAPDSRSYGRAIVGSSGRALALAGGDAEIKRARRDSCTTFRSGSEAAAERRHGVAPLQQGIPYTIDAIVSEGVAIAARAGCHHHHTHAYDGGGPQTSTGGLARISRGIRAQVDGNDLSILSSDPTTTVGATFVCRLPRSFSPIHALAARGFSSLR